jgi:hypothetical protein
MSKGVASTIDGRLFSKFVMTRLFDTLYHILICTLKACREKATWYTLLDLVMYIMSSSWQGYLIYFIISIIWWFMHCVMDFLKDSIGTPPIYLFTNRCYNNAKIHQKVKTNKCLQNWIIGPRVHTMWHMNILIIKGKKWIQMKIFIINIFVNVNMIFVQRQTHPWVVPLGTTSRNG